MKTKLLSFISVVVICLGSGSFAQEKICIDGKCQSRPGLANTIVLEPLREQLTLVGRQTKVTSAVASGDRFEKVIQATVRVTVSGVCGSGTVVGRSQEGNAIVLTNAHVAGTTRGRSVNVERWNTNGVSEKGTGTIIASGYGRGTSVDFALLKCNEAFAKDVDPIPLADRYPNIQSSVTTFGCPRCEWPSLQVLRLNRKEGQILSWKPEAIGGRSGSSLIDYTDEGPRVVGLLTWAGGGEGLGQSTPFLLSAMRGKLPTTLEALPAGAKEVSAQTKELSVLAQVPSTTQGKPLKWPMPLVANTQVQDDVIDSIIERPRIKPAPQEPDDSGLLRDQLRPSLPWTPTGLVATSAASSILLFLTLQYGLPLVLQAIRNIRKSRGNTLLNDEQFKQLMDQYQQLLKLMEQNSKPPPNIKS
ncbi:MAG: trypsin-like peptidase domain-containing protein [Planctomycetes bacterium]|nr:trypsin-like peptidase domain-containing protein [Planctomycetota bacterium]